jgi:hypothetical protein
MPPNRTRVGGHAGEEDPVDNSNRRRAICLAASYLKTAKLHEELAEELETQASLVEEIVRREASDNDGSDLPVYGAVAELTFDGVRANGGQTAWLDGVPVDLTRLEAAALQELDLPGGVRGDDGHEYKPPSLIASRIAERLGRARQTDGAVSAVLCRLRGKIAQARTDSKELIVYCNGARGWRLVRAAAPVNGTLRAR